MMCTFFILKYTGSKLLLYLCMYVDGLLNNCIFLFGRGSPPGTPTSSHNPKIGPLGQLVSLYLPYLWVCFRVFLVFFCPVCLCVALYWIGNLFRVYSFSCPVTFEMGISPPTPFLDKQQRWMDGWMDIFFSNNTNPVLNHFLFICTVLFFKIKYIIAKI